MELRRFKAPGNPFMEEFFKDFQSIHHQQLQMLDKMQMRKNKLDKKLKSIKARRKLIVEVFHRYVLPMRVFTSIQENAPVSGISLQLIINLTAA
ncbi:hypothetical protein ZIOFF_021846 [Zingiber officinale]|uniref:Uncharacterized protein n=1 Tax=Zingiber officinale TaxID=94328 RepID=A0A8J5L8V4_ZINOF|nr:hypothetical protein ZIOFF_021846 [Zingiber officinale]